MHALTPNLIMVVLNFILVFGRWWWIANSRPRLRGWRQTRFRCSGRRNCSRRPRPRTAWAYSRSRSYSQRLREVRAWRAPRQAGRDISRFGREWRMHQRSRRQNPFFSKRVQRPRQHRPRRGFSDHGHPRNVRMRVSDRGVCMAGFLGGWNAWVTRGEGGPGIDPIHHGLQLGLE